MKVMALIAAHLPLVPLTWADGRRAKSAHADTDIDTWTEARASSSAYSPVLSSDHRYFDLSVFLLRILGQSAGGCWSLLSA